MRLIIFVFLLILSCSLLAQEGTTCSIKKQEKELTDSIVDIKGLTTLADLNAGPSGIAMGLLCDSMESDLKKDHKEALKYLYDEGINLEDVYFEIQCRPSTQGYMFHYCKELPAANYFLRYLKHRENKTGQKFLDPILNALHLSLATNKEETVLDHFAWLRDHTTSQSLKIKYQALVDLYRSYGAKYAFELKQ